MADDQLQEPYDQDLVHSDSQPARVRPRWPRVVVIAVIVTLGTGLGALWWLGHDIQTDLPTPAPAVPTAWRTYTNVHYGFEFKYPNYLTAKEYSDVVDTDQSDRGVDLNGPDANTRIGLSIDNTVYVGGGPEKTTLSKDVIYGDYEWRKTKGYAYQILPLRMWFIRYSTSLSGHLFVFSIYKDDKIGVDAGTHPIDAAVESRMDQIISTFRFTE